MRMTAFFWTQFAGAFNDNFYKNAMILWISFGAAGLDAGQRSSLVIACSAVFILPFFLFSATAGWLADAYAKDRVIRWTKLAEIMIMAGGALAFILGNIPALLLILFFMGAQSAWFGPAKYGVMPDLVSEEGLMRANGLVAMGTFIAILTGTLFGGLAGTRSDGRTLVALTILVVAIIGWLWSLRIPHLLVSAPGLKRTGGMLRETWTRLAEIRREKRIFPLLLAISWFWFHGACILQLLPIWVMKTQGEQFLAPGFSYLTADGASPGGSLVTLSLLLFSGGIGLGSMLAGWRKTRHIETADSVSALVLLALTALLLPLVDGVPSLTMLLLALSGVAAGAYSVPLYSAIQSAAGPEQRARVFSAGNILDAAFMVAASIIMQALEWASIPPVQRFAIIGGLDLVFLFVWLWPRSDLVRRFWLRFVQDRKRELYARPDHACLVVYPASLSRPELASLALSFPCLPVELGTTASPTQIAGLISSGVYVLRADAGDSPLDLPRCQVRLAGLTFTCHQA